MFVSLCVCTCLYRYRGTPVAVKRLRESLQKTPSDAMPDSDNDAIRQLRPTIVYSGGSSHSLGSSMSGRSVRCGPRGLILSQGVGSFVGSTGKHRNSRAWSKYIRYLEKICSFFARLHFSCSPPFGLMTHYVLAVFKSRGTLST